MQERVDRWSHARQASYFSTGMVLMFEDHRAGHQHAARALRVVLDVDFREAELAAVFLAPLASSKAL